MRSRLLIVLFASMILLVVNALGQASAAGAPASPVGRWRTVDDATGKEKSVVVIWEENNKLHGKIEKLLYHNPNNPNSLCLHCEGELKDKPLIGLRILWDLKPDGTQWSGGRILDPDNGKIYRCNLAVEDGGKKLKVRGFIGFSLIGRTQYWLPEE